MYNGSPLSLQLIPLMKDHIFCCVVLPTRLVATVTALLAVLVEVVVKTAVEEIAPINNIRSLAHQICIQVSMRTHTHKYI